MGKISLIQYSPQRDNGELTAQIVECYRDVFADAPWHEWLQCSRCKKYWGIKDLGLLVSAGFRHCNMPLVDFWPREHVTHDLQTEITENASCWLAMDGEKVIGFCWGYPITITKLVSKLGIPVDDSLQADRNGLVAYQDEVGVRTSYRGNKIAKTMVLRRLDDFISQGLQFGIVRTRKTPEPSVTFSWYTTKLGFRVLAEYPNGDGRVILGREFSGLKELLVP